MPLAFSTIGCPDYTAGQVADTARRLGYGGLEIRFLRGTTDIAALPEIALPAFMRFMAARSGAE